MYWSLNSNLSFHRSRPRLRSIHKKIFLSVKPTFGLFAFDRCDISLEQQNKIDKPEDCLHARTPSRVGEMMMMMDVDLCGSTRWETPVNRPTTNCQTAAPVPPSSPVVYPPRSNRQSGMRKKTGNTLQSSSVTQTSAGFEKSRPFSTRRLGRTRSAASSPERFGAFVICGVVN